MISIRISLKNSGSYTVETDKMGTADEAAAKIAISVRDYDLIIAQYADRDIVIIPRENVSDILITAEEKE